MRFTFSNSLALFALLMLVISQVAFARDTYDESEDSLYERDFDLEDSLAAKSMVARSFADHIEDLEESLYTRSEPEDELFDARDLDYLFDTRDLDDYESFDARDLDYAVDEELVARGKTWGNGKYTMDLDHYHKNVKPEIIKGFQAAGHKLPGRNPDFEVDRKGNVKPSSVKGGGGKNPSMTVHELGIAHHFGRRGLEDEDDDELMARGKTWGNGKYTMDLDHYHKNVKPEIIKGFQAAGHKLPGRNPDFEVDRKGNVKPSSVKGGGGKNPSMTVHELGIAHHFGRRDFDSEDDEELMARGKTWGNGKYTMDLDHYHKNVKPEIIKGFQAAGHKLPGRNPDFEVDRKGNVKPSSVKGGGGKNPSMTVHELGIAHHFG